MFRNKLFILLLVLVLGILGLSTESWSQQSGEKTLECQDEVLCPEGGNSIPISTVAPDDINPPIFVTLGITSLAEITLTYIGPDELDPPPTWSESSVFDGGEVNWPIDFDSLGLPAGQYRIEEKFSLTVEEVLLGIIEIPLVLSAEFDSWETYIPPHTEIIITATLRGSGNLSGDFTGSTEFFNPIPDYIWNVVITSEKPGFKAEEPIDFELSFNVALGKETLMILPDNERPVLTSVNIGVEVEEGIFDSSETAYTYSVLGVESIEAEDDFTPVDRLKKIYRWLKDGQEIVSGETFDVANLVLDGANFNKLDTISLELIVEDGGGLQSEPPMGSNEIPIADSPPSKPEVAIVARGAPAGTPLTREHDLLCQIITESIDPDEGDVVTYNYEWSKDDEIQPELTDAVVSKDLFEKGQIWKCTVTPVSADLKGESAEASGVIENAPISIEEISDRTITETFTLEFTLPIVDADGDGDINTPTYTISPTPEESPEIVLGSYIFRWTPSRNDSDDETGFETYTITITVTDIDGAEATTTFNVTVNNLNRPVGIEVTGNTASEGKGDRIELTVTVTDDDPDPTSEPPGPSLWTYSVSAEIIFPAGAPLGSLTAAVNDFNKKSTAENTDQKERIFFWSPNPSDEGKNFRLRFTVKDNGKPTPSADQETVTISVDANKAPIVEVTKDGDPVGNVPIFMKENESLTLNITGTDPDDTDIVKISVVSVLMDEGIATLSATLPSQLVDDGTAILGVAEDGAEGTFMLQGDVTPISPGLYSAAFTATDDDSANPLTDSQTVIINVEDVNESPEFLFDPVTQEVNETETVSITAEVTDGDGDVLTISAEAVDADGYPMEDFPAGSQLSSLKFDSATGIYSRTFTWTLGYDVTTKDRSPRTAARIVFTADDGRGETGEENSSTSSQKWVIRATDKNRAPVILSITGVAPIYEDETLLVTVTVRDDDKEMVTISAEENALPGGGSFTLGDSSFNSETGITTREMAWTAPFDVATAADPTVFATVEIKADDGNTENNTDTEDLPIVVNNANRSPQVTITNVAVNEGDMYSATVEASDPDAEDRIHLTASDLPLPHVFTPQEFTLVDNPDTQVFEWQTDYNVVIGMDEFKDITFKITADDQNGLPNSVVEQPHDMTVNDNNDLPVVVPDSLSVTVAEGQLLVIGPTGTPVPEGAVFAQIDVTDNLDNDPLDYSVTDEPSGLTLAGAIVVWQTGYDDAGEHIFNYNVIDMHATLDPWPMVTAEVTVEVTETNRKPELDPVGSIVFVTDDIGDYTFTAFDPDTDDPLRYSLTSLSDPPLPDGLLNEETGLLIWAPEVDDINSYTVRVEVRDREAPGDADVMTDFEEFVIAVRPPDDNPPVISDVNVSVDPDSIVIDDNEIDETETVIVTFDVNDPDDDPVTPSADLLTSEDLVTIEPITDGGGNVIGARVEWQTDLGDAGDHKLQLQATSIGTSGIPLPDTEIIDLTVNKFNILPQVSDVTILPEPPTGADDLTVNYTFSDENLDSENGTQIKWYRSDADDPERGDEVTNLRNSRVVLSVLTSPGDKWTVTVNPSDDGGITFGYAEGSEPFSEVTIVDTPPEFRDPSVSPSEGTIATEFEFSVTYIDEDNQAPDSVVVNISSSEITLSMMKKDPVDNNFTEAGGGVEYTAKISGLNKGSHTYEFVATYGEETKPSGPNSGPTINDSPAVVSAVTTYGKTGDITVSYNLVDLDGEHANIRLDYSSSGGVFWIQNAVIQSNVAPGVGLSLTWPSPAGVDKTSYLVRIVPNGDIANAGTSSAFIVDNEEPDEPEIISIGGRDVDDGTIVGGNVFGPSFDVVGTGEPNAEARGYGSSRFTAPIDGSGNFSISFSGLSDGEHTISVTVFDGTHEGEPTSLQINVDTVPPTIDVITPADGSEVPKRKPTFKARMEDFGSGLDSHTVSVAGNTYTMAYNPADKTASYTLESELGQGVSYPTVFKATDNGGLTTEIVVTFTVNIGADDKIPPVIGNLTPTGFITTTEFQISARVVDSESGVNNEPGGYSAKIVKTKNADGTDIPEVDQVENSLSATMSPISASESEISAPVTEGDLTVTSTVSGEYRIEVEASDKATPEANKAQAIWMIIVDIDDPEPITFDDETPTLTNKLIITLMGMAERNSTVSISVNSGTPLTTIADGSTGDFTISGVSLSREGRNTISGTATDAAGNSSPATTIEINRDTVRPTITDPVPADGDIVGEERPTAYLTGIDAYGIDETSIQFSFDGEPIEEGIGDGFYTYDAGSGQLSYRPSDPFTETGTHTFGASVTDLAGNESSEFSSSFLYQAGLGDNVAPVISNFQYTEPYMISAMVSDNTEIFSITIQVTGPADAPYGVPPNPDGIDSISYSYEPPRPDTVDLEFSLNELEDLIIDGALPDGTYTITIQAEDADNPDQRTFTVELDTTTPAPLLSYTSRPDDVIGGDGRIYTSDSQILVQGSGSDPGDLVTVYKNGIPHGTDVASSGIEISVSLSLGANEIKAKAEDINGNESDDSNILNFTLDLTPPSISGFNILNSIGDDVTGKLTKDGEITVNFTVAELQDATNVGVEQTPPVGEEPTTLTIKKDGIPFQTAPPPGTGPDYSVSLSLTLDGVYTFIVETEDELGNEASAQAEVILDTQALTVNINTPSGDTTASVTPNITATIDGLDIDIGSVEMWLSSGQENAVAAGATANGDVAIHVYIATAGGGSVSYFPSAELEDGLFYRVEVTASDLAGNPTPAASKVFQVVAGDDEIGPIITQFIPLPDDTISSEALQVIAVFLADEFSGVDPATVLFEINGYFYTLEELLGETEIATFRETGLLVINLKNLRLFQLELSQLENPLELSQLERPTSLSRGKNNVRVQATDRAGNISEAQWSFNVVTEPPKSPILKDIVSPISETAIIVEGTVSGVSTTNPVSVIVTVDGAIAGKGSVNPDNGSFIVENVSLSAGTNSIRTYATDSVGNQSKPTSSVEVTVDWLPPVVTIEPLPTVTNQPQITVRAAISDNTSLPISAVNLVLNGESESVTPKAKLEIPVTLASGSNTIVIEAFDAAGNKGISTEATVELDTIGLDIAPGNLVVQVDMTGENIKLTWQEVEEAYAYNVYRSQYGAISDATELLPIIQNINATSSLDKTVVPSITYFYAVTALDSAGNENKQLVSNSPNAALIIGTNGGQAILQDGTKAVLQANGIADNVLLSASVAINVLDDSSVPELKREVSDSVREFGITMQDGSAIDKFKKTVRITIPYSEQIEDTPHPLQLFVLTEDGFWTKVENQTTDTKLNIVTGTVQNLGVYRLATSLPPWDVNGDEQVDIQDLMLVSEQFGKTNPEIGDVDGSGTVDISDLALVGVHLGESYKK